VPDTASVVSQVLQKQPTTDAHKNEHTFISGKFTLETYVGSSHTMALRSKPYVFCYMCTKEFTT